MISIEDLKGIYLLRGLPQAVLEKMLPLTRCRDYKEREVVFEEGQRAECFYMLRRGKVILEVDLSTHVSMSLGSIKPGYSFGWSALTQDDPVHKSRAISIEPSEILCIPGSQFLNILNQDPAVAYEVMREIFAILKRRLERRTAQLVNVMRKYPGMRELIEETS